MLRVRLDKTLAFFGLAYENVGIMLLHKRCSNRVFFANYDLFRIFQHSAKQRANAGRTCADDQNRVRAFDFGNTRRPKSRCENISHKQGLLVRYAVGDFVQALIGKRHAHVLGLSAVNPASQCPTAVFVRAVVDVSVFAEKTLSTKRFHVDGHSISRFDGFDVVADFFDNAHHLVSHGDSRHGFWHRSVLDVQVACANAPKRHAHDRIARVCNLRLFFVNQFKFSVFYIGQRFHFSPHKSFCILYTTKRHFSQYR